MKNWVSKHRKKLLLIIGLVIVLLSGTLIGYNKASKKTFENAEKPISYHIKDYVLYEGENLPTANEFVEEQVSEIEIHYYQDNIEIQTPTEPGEYAVQLKIAKKEYWTKLKIQKKKEISLALKEKTIYENEPYQIADFIKECKSENDCTYQFAKETMALYKEVGEYQIEIIAKDQNGSEAKSKTKLTILKKEEPAKQEESSVPEPSKPPAPSNPKPSVASSKPTYVKQITESKTMTRVWKYKITETVDIVEYYDLYSDGSKVKVNTTSKVKERNYTTFQASTFEMESEARSLMQTNASQIKEVITLTNQLRAEKGLPLLTYHETLTKAAMIRAIEMGYSKVFSHTRPDGRNCFTIYDELQIAYGIAAENIAQGYTSPSQVVTGWKNSAGHYQNMMNPNIKRIGVGVIKENGTYYWVQLFS